MEKKFNCATSFRKTTFKIQERSRFTLLIFTGSRAEMDEFASDPTVLQPSPPILQLLSFLIGRMLSHSIS